jgi:hypothetical protein
MNTSVIESVLHTLDVRSSSIPNRATTTISSLTGSIGTPLCSEVGLGMNDAVDEGVAGVSLGPSIETVKVG